jgi:hypothetical protein
MILIGEFFRRVIGIVYVSDDGSLARWPFCQSYILAEKFSDKFLSQNNGQNFIEIYRPTCHTILHIILWHSEAVVIFII